MGSTQEAAPPPALEQMLGKYMTTQEAADALGCNATRVRVLLREGKLRGFQVDYVRGWLVDPASVRERIAELGPQDERRGGRKPSRELLKIREMVEQGASLSEIADEVPWPASYIRRAIDRDEAKEG